LDHVVEGESLDSKQCLTLDKLIHLDFEGWLSADSDSVSISTVNIMPRSMGAL
jgi:hypothetical protein